jgi:transcription elongation GreA/GreB family factor
LDIQFKVRLYQALLKEVDQRAQNLQDSLIDALDSTANETKSTAGDKHETGRAMAQLEQEKIGSQIAEITKLKEILFRIQPEKNHSKVELGSLVTTSNGIFFISIGIGAFPFEGKSVFCITPMAPVCQLLLGKQVGEQVEWQGKKIEINRVA